VHEAGLRHAYLVSVEPDIFIDKIERLAAGA
jgi:hypothetical protein